MNKMECLSRRNNLLFYNVEEYQAPLKTKICHILTAMGVQDVQSIVFDDIHRMGPVSKSAKPKPIIIRLLHRTDRDRIWESRRNLKGTKYSLNEDFPEDYQKDRTRLMPVVKAARASGLKATLIANKVKVDGKLYDVQHINKLPSNCNPERACVKENKDTMCFFGQYTPLSNFFPCKFKINSTDYNCMEQFIQSKKCEILRNDEMAQKVMGCHDPHTQKKIGNSLKVNYQPWYSAARAEVLPALREKFRQNQDLQACLLSTGDKVIGEATQDKFWGIGLTLNNPQTLSNNLWQGKNMMGELLMIVRTELKGNM
jgi:ribA/ribD-fused uncharacterized protein